MLRFEERLITPSLAKELLEANVSNRHHRSWIVKSYSQDMLNGRWKVNTAEPIKISKTGVILDGQHRLMAIISSGVPIMQCIAYNLDDSVFDVLDTGVPRSAKDVFRIQGIKNEVLTPAIIAMFNLLETGRKTGSKKNAKSTNAMLLEQYLENSIFWSEVARKSLNWYKSFTHIMPPSVIGGFYAHFYYLNKDKADDFMEQLTTGTNISNDIILTLRQKLMQDKMSQRKMPQTLKMAIIIKSWNSFVSGKKLKVLKFDLMRDSYPTAIPS